MHIRFFAVKVQYCYMCRDLVLEQRPQNLTDYFSAALEELLNIFSTNAKAGVSGAVVVVFLRYAKYPAAIGSVWFPY
jgi:hypothetical protein